MRNVIGICGPLGSGKSTIAQHLCKMHGAKRLSFAEPLKKMLEALGVPYRHLYGTQAEKAEPLELFSGRSSRDAMQTLGTEWGRAQFGPDFWARAWEARLNQQAPAFAVADDVRFASEVDAIKRAGGLVLCVVRSLSDLEAVPAHPSEDFAALDYDVLLVNNGTPGELFERLECIISYRLQLEPA